MNRYTHQLSDDRYFQLDQSVTMIRAIADTENQVLLLARNALIRITVVTVSTNMVFVLWWKRITSMISPENAMMNTVLEAALEAFLSALQISL